MPLLIFLVVLVAVLLTAIASTTLWWMMHAWRSESNFEATKVGDLERPLLSFSIIVPCRAESEAVMAETVQRLMAQQHPNFEVIISLGDDDVDTISAARRIASRDARIRVAINSDPIKNKPRQLNSTLPECTKEIVGIIDAESLTAPYLLWRIDNVFTSDHADMVQGAVHLVNLRSRWFSLRNCLEYRIWFRSRLHGHAGNGFVPLGGNTVFIRRHLLEQVGGWDGDCLAEDCEIGVRLSVQGRRTVCVYAPELITREETPDTLRAFIKQRTRWSLGFMQVTAKGEWRKLPTFAERARAGWLLGQQYTVAFAGVVFPLAVASAIVGNLPVLAVLVSFLPLIPTVLTLAFEAIVLHEFGKDLGERIRAIDYVWLIVCTPAYQAVLAFSSLRALAKYMTGSFSWEKTSHVGAHIETHQAGTRA